MPPQRALVSRPWVGEVKQNAEAREEARGGALPGGTLVTRSSGGTLVTRSPGLFCLSSSDRNVCPTSSGSGPWMASIARASSVPGRAGILAWAAITADRGWHICTRGFASRRGSNRRRTAPADQPRCAGRGGASPRRTTRCRWAASRRATAGRAWRSGERGFAKCRLRRRPCGCSRIDHEALIDQKIAAAGGQGKSDGHEWLLGLGVRGSGLGARDSGRRND